MGGAAPSDRTDFLNTSKLDLMEIYWVGIWWESKCCTMQVEKSKGSWAKLFWKVYVHFRMEYIHLWQGTKYNSFLGWDSRKKMCREGLCQKLVLVMDAKSAVVDPIWISYSPYPGSRMIPKPAPRLPFIWEQIWGGKSAGKLLGLGNGDWELNLLWTQARSAARREKHKQLARKDDISPTIGTELGTSRVSKGDLIF